MLTIGPWKKGVKPGPCSPLLFQMRSSSVKLLHTKKNVGAPPPATVCKGRVLSSCLSVPLFCCGMYG